MASKNLLLILVLRIFTLLLSAASIVLIVTNNFVANGSKTKFSDVSGYRYLIAAGGAGALYTLIQLPFSMYHAVKGKRMIRGKFLPNFDFYGDKVIGLVLASGVGVGFGVSIELKDNVDNFVNISIFEDFRSDFKKFCDRGTIASGVLLGGCLTLVFLSILSSLNKSAKTFFG